MGPLLEDKYAVIIDGVIYAECASDDIAYDLATKKSDELLQLGELTSTVYVARIYLERRIFNRYQFYLGGTTHTKLSLIVLSFKDIFRLQVQRSDIVFRYTAYMKFFRC